MKVDNSISWRHQINNVAHKLNRVNAMLSNIRHFVSFKTLKLIYQTIFESHLYYSWLVWAQNANSIKRLLFLQKKFLILMHFLKRNAYTSKLFKNLNIFKLSDKVTLENCTFICKCFNYYLIKTFKIWFTLPTVSHTHNTR